MPRTKMPRKKQGDNAVLPVENNVKLEGLKKLIETKRNAQLLTLDEYCKRKRLNINRKIAHITIGEFNNLNGFSNSTTASSIVQQIFDRTRTMQNSRFLTTTNIRRSNSFDEGGRESRAKRRPPTARRMSRSASPKTATANSTTNNKSVMGRYQTPQNRAPPLNAYALVTPKVNPNTPQVLLRRPKQGEMVLSLQGSPLYTGGITSEQDANINIPLENGQLLSIQPRKGLRLSQIPQLHPETARQLETLRDNLNKVCAVSAKR